jgi:hypothetical protein
MTCVRTPFPSLTGFLTFASHLAIGSVMVSCLHASHTYEIHCVAGAVSETIPHKNVLPCEPCGISKVSQKTSKDRSDTYNVCNQRKCMNRQKISGEQSDLNVMGIPERQCDSAQAICTSEYYFLGMYSPLL